MSRFYIDCEFIDTGSTIDLISIGIVCNDGRELYLQSVEFDPEDANDWVKENVFPHLLYCSFRRIESRQSYGSKCMIFPMTIST